MIRWATSGGPRKDMITLWIAALLTLITGWDYLRVGLKHMD